MKKKKAIKPKKEEKQKYYKGLAVDSEGEIHFIQYMDELKEAGYIEYYERGLSYMLSDSLSNNYAVQLKTRSKPMRQNILMGHSYNYDFNIKWAEKGIKYFVNRFGEKWEKPFLINSKNMSFIECKPAFDFQNMTRLAVLNVKWMWDKHKIFIQMVKNIELFEKTFTPKAYEKTKTGKTRDIKHTFRTLEQYINGK